MCSCQCAELSFEELFDLDTVVKLKKNYYRRQGRVQERQRIVELLEQWRNDDNADFGETLKEIKGENK